MSEENNITEGDWHWVIHDHSCASLGVGDDPGLGTPLVMSVSPCRSCIDSAKNNNEDWKWGRCCTPEEADAMLIASAPTLLNSVDMVWDVLDDLAGYYEDRDSESFWETILVLRTNLKWARKKARNEL